MRSRYELSPNQAALWTRYELIDAQARRWQPQRPTQSGVRQVCYKLWHVAAHASSWLAASSRSQSKNWTRRADAWQVDRRHGGLGAGRTIRQR